MNTKKQMSIAVIFLAAAIIFVSSTPMTNHVFAKKHDAQDDSGSKYYENFLNCLSDASGGNSSPTGNQIVNCFAESGYIQGSSGASNTDDSQDETGNVDVSALPDHSSSDDNSHDSSSADSSSADSSSADSSSADSSSADSSSADSSSNDNSDDSSSNDSFIDSADDSNE